MLTLPLLPGNLTIYFYYLKKDFSVSCGGKASDTWGGLCALAEKSCSSPCLEGSLVTVLGPASSPCPDPIPANHSSSTCRTSSSS